MHHHSPLYHVITIISCIIIVSSIIIVFKNAMRKCIASTLQTVQMQDQYMRIYIVGVIRKAAKLLQRTIKASSTRYTQKKAMGASNNNPNIAVFSLPPFLITKVLIVNNKKAL